MEFYPMEKDVLNVGKRIKSTKKRYSWKFKIGKIEHELNLYVSKLSSKRKIILDGNIEFNGKRTSGVLFEHSVRIQGVSCQVYQKEEGYEFKVRNENFSDKLTQRAKAWMSKKREKSEQHSTLTQGWEEIDIDAQEEENKVQDFKPRSAKPLQLPSKPVRAGKENNPPVPANKPKHVKHDSNQDIPELFKAPAEAKAPEEPKAPSMFDLLDFAPPEPELPMAEALSNIVISDNPSSQPPSAYAEPPSMPAQSVGFGFSEIPAQPEAQMINSRLSVQQTQHIYDPEPVFVQRSQNPFGEEETIMQPQNPINAPVAQPDMFNGLIDLDNLHLGDGYSPMVAQRMEAAKAPVEIKNPMTPNIPMNQFATQMPQMQPMNMPDMQMMMTNAAMMAPSNSMNPFSKQMPPMQPANMPDMQMMMPNAPQMAPNTSNNPFGTQMAPMQQGSMPDQQMMMQNPAMMAQMMQNMMQFMTHE